MRERRLKTRSERGTIGLGETILELICPPPRLIVIRGNLGAGKTTLVKGIAEAMGAAKAEDVTSPTFTLVHEYDGRKLKLYHLDLYRLESESELAALGIEEMEAEANALVIVEWGEKFPSLVARAGGEILMEHLEGDERSIFVRVK